MIILAKEKPFAAVVDDEHLGTICSSCFSAKEDIFRCSRCRVIHYCSAECQALDWTDHKLECLFLQKCPQNVPSSICRLMARIALKLGRGESHEPAFNGRLYEELADHRAQIHICPERSKLFAKVSQALGKFVGEKVTLEPALISSIYGKVTENSFTIRDLDDAIGQGLYIGLSVHGHTGNANAYVHFEGVKAILDSPAKEMKYSKDLVISYTRYWQKPDDHDLLYTYHFKCCCPKCIYPPLASNEPEPWKAAKEVPDKNSSTTSSSTCCPDSYRLLDSTDKHMRCYKCGLVTPVVGDEEINESLLEPKIEEPDDLPEEIKNPPSPGNPLYRILQQLNEADDGNKKKIKSEPCEEHQQEAVAVTTPQMVQDVPVRISPEPYPVRKIVIKSKDTSTYSSSAPRRFKEAPPARAATKIAKKVDELCTKYEKDEQAARVVYTARRSLPTILPFNRHLVAKMTYRSRAAPYSFPNAPLDNHFIQQNRMNCLPPSLPYVVVNDQRIQRPLWSYPHMVAVCILCSRDGYVNTPEVYDFVELYFPYYNTNMTRSYRCSLRNALSRLCDKYLVDDQYAKRASSWTLRASLLDTYKMQINRFLRCECASIGVNDFVKLIYSIHWSRPAILTDEGAAQAPRQTGTILRSVVPATIPRLDDRPESSGNSQFSGQSSSTFCGEAATVDNMVNSAAYGYSDHEYTVWRPAKVEDSVEFEKPDWKISEMLTLAIMTFENGHGTLHAMYQFIHNFFPYYASTQHWKASARRALYGSKYFVKYPQEGHSARNFLYKLNEHNLESTVTAVHAYMCTEEARIGVQHFDVLKELIDVKRAAFL